MEAVFIIVGIALLGAMTPGPDFILITRLSLQRSRAAGVAAALGVGLGLCVHLTYMTVGLAVIIAQTPWLLNVIRVIGAFYLIYLGVQAWRESKNGSAAVKRRVQQSFLQGFLNNLLNPKVMLFLLALISSVEAHYSTSIVVTSALFIIIVNTTWFVTLSYCITLPRFTAIFSHVQRYIGKVLGSFLILFAIFILVFETGLWAQLMH